MQADRCVDDKFLSGRNWESAVAGGCPSHSVATILLYIYCNINVMGIFSLPVDLARSVGRIVLQALVGWYAV